MSIKRVAKLQFGVYSHKELPDLVVVGTGMRKSHQMTQEAWGLLEEAEILYGTLNDTLLVEVLATKLDAEVVDFSGIYDPYDKEKRFNTYFECMLTPLEEASQRDGLVAYVGVGNPGIYAYTSSNIRRIGEDYWGLDVETYAGVPASIEIYNLLNIDPAEGGTQELTISRAVNENVTLNSNMSYFGWLIGHAHEEVTGPQPLERTSRYLSEQYHPDKDAYLVRATNGPFNTAAVRRVKLKNVGHIDRMHLRGCSLVVPKGEVKPEAHMPNRFSDEQVELLKSPGVREERQIPSALEPALLEAGKETLSEVVVKAYTDYAFYIALRDNPEEALSEFDLTEEELELILNETKQKGDRTMTTYIEDLTGRQ